MIIQADILQWAAAYDGPLFHALLTDPPYHLTSITERFGRPGSAPAQFGSDGAFARASRGFMNATWDGGDIAFRPETWAALGRLLHPGAFIMAFAGTRGYHRMACAIEDAGFILHPVICWNFASGFPKATRLDTQIDRAAGAERETVGKRPQTGAKFKLTQELIDNGGFNDPDRDDYDVTAPATPLARAWAGHRYGGQALKPAIELICVAQKPYVGRPVDSITRTGAGAINVDGGRIDSEPIPTFNSSHGHRFIDHGNDVRIERTGETSSMGRWPANLVLSHAPGCNGACAPGCPVAALGAQSGELQSGDKHGFYRRDSRGIYGDYPPQEQHVDGDSGTAARFFFNADYALERLEDADPLIYVPKSSTAEREAGLADFSPTTVDDGREKSIDNAYQRGETSRRNTHPTIKPIALARHLATLLLPPDLYAPRRLLIPFAGAGSETIGAMLAGWEEIAGIELEAAHVAIARARIAFWQQMKYKLMNPDAPVKVAISRNVPDGQRDMFDE